ncbi:outer membrane protein assembly factor BamC [Pseudidiomarina sp. 1APP75-32.1]|uniref:Outer membrane protein assembly factor BamC n=1 Tax=Pseudidiomarina terrestris TaxID=2820060 RepID=A0AAW7QV79_9GAMM|nr:MULTISPECIES: outer membrane protein assembly factor BamC [unclassified Pseudidiomarina]MDN7124102.1 outer membrane protein assembly factor BamC [Pseudidiomarina sp. 1APP75-32.1]MDN7128359.1 outer membrane protein assembly factor BamC [Pseudidiomarina sp. 1APR75-15]
MKFSHIGILSITSLALAACSFTPREHAEGSFDYTKKELVEPLQPAPGKQVPQSTNRYNVPETEVDGAVGKNINIIAPVLVRATAAGSRPSQAVGITAVDFSELEGMDDLPSFTWQEVKDTLQRKNIAIEEEVDEQRLKTGWDAERLEVGEDELEVVIERRYEVLLDVPDHRRLVTLEVNMIDKRESGPGRGVLPSGVADTNAEARLLNSMINEIAVRQQGIFKAAEEAAVVNVEPTFNDKGYPAYKIDIGFDAAWPLMADVIENLGFEIEDLDQSQGMYYTNYLRDTGLSLFFWNSRNEGKLDLPDGDYQINVKGDGDETVITILRDEQPLTAADIDRLYGPVAAEIRQRSAL